MSTLDDLARVEQRVRLTGDSLGYGTGKDLCAQADTIAAYIAAQRERGAANGWRPIETAPKDGKRVLLSWPSTLVTVGQISNLRAGAEWPTHWMPLPEPPKENSNG